MHAGKRDIYPETVKPSKIKMKEPGIYMGKGHGGGKFRIQSVEGNLGRFRVQMSSTWPGIRGLTVRWLTVAKVLNTLLRLKLQPELLKNQLVQAEASARLCAL